MKKHKAIPLINICSLQKQENKGKDDFIIEPFAAYLKRHPNLFVPHRHSFYHVVLFTAGSGHHTIDFEQFAVREGQMYFMIPGQVHSWQFEGSVDGFVVNFSEQFFSTFLQNNSYLEQFLFLEGIAGNSVLNMDASATVKVAALMQQMLQEEEQKQVLYNEVLKLKLLELFLVANRSVDLPAIDPVAINNDLVVRNFRKLVAKHFATMRLPKDYAALLYITPNHLNALCNDKLGKPAGSVIRDRIILEAKRLLVNADTNINEIAWELNFEDNSYFSKFFKKATGLSPETFRNNILIHS